MIVGLRTFCPIDVEESHGHGEVYASPAWSITFRISEKPFEWKPSAVKPMRISPGRISGRGRSASLSTAPTAKPAAS